MASSRVKRNISGILYIFAGNNKIAMMNKIKTFCVVLVLLLNSLVTSAVSSQVIPDSITPIMDFIDYPAGDTRLSWGMNFSQVQSITNKLGHPVYMKRTGDGIEYERMVELYGSGTVTFGSDKFTGRAQRINIFCTGESPDELIINKLSIDICFYDDPAQYVPGQNLNDYAKSHPDCTKPAEEAYACLLKEVKKAGGRVIKWDLAGSLYPKSFGVYYKKRFYVISITKTLHEETTWLHISCYAKGNPYL